jgi:hypothetical protein
LLVSTSKKGLVMPNKECYENEFTNKKLEVKYIISILIILICIVMYIMKPSTSIDSIEGFYINTKKYIKLNSEKIVLGEIKKNKYKQLLDLDINKRYKGLSCYYVKDNSSNSVILTIVFYKEDTIQLNHYIDIKFTDYWFAKSTVKYYFDGKLKSKYTKK